MEKIERITTERLSLPLRTSFKTARHIVNTADAVVVKIESGNAVGYGAATPNLIVTGDTLFSIENIIQEILAPKIVGRSLDDWQHISSIIQESLQYNFSAKAGLDIALYNLLADELDISLITLLGGRRQQVNTDYTISIASAEEMASKANKIATTGFKAIKIKIDGNLERDVQRIEAIGQALKPDISLRIDANQSLTYKEARALITSLSRFDFNIDFLEQPLPASDISGMVKLTRDSFIPIMADESVYSPTDAVRILTQHGCDYINIKLMKSGGLSSAIKINTLAESFGVACMVGCMIETPISIAAAVDFVAANPNVKFVDLDSIYMLKSQKDVFSNIKMLGPELIR